MLLFNHPIPLSLYIHIPWCVKKCPYCDFNSHASENALPEAAYVDALLADLENELPQIWGRRLTSIFIGGGTPSLFSAKAIETLLAGVRARIPLLPNAEITLEANPGTLETNRFHAFRAAGITRVSIGIQSFQEDKLQKLGRIHSAKQAMAAVEQAHLANFNSFNIDLMYGLPAQSLSDALYDINAALSLNPPHLSWYQLTLEPNTVFHRKPPAQLPADEALYQIELAGRAQLATKDLHAYEVSAYSLPNHQCQHNRNYWEFGDYIGIGAGAHGKITLPQENKVIRTRKKRMPASYLDKTTSFLAETVTLSPQDLAFEFMLNALRLTDGIPKALFNERTGLSQDALKPALTQAKSLGLLQETAEKWQPTQQGQQFLNDLVTLFIP